MTSINFVGTYKPMMCGIADYTDFIIRESSDNRCGVISFDLAKFPGRLIKNPGVICDRVWYGIPDFHNYSASIIQNALQQLGVGSDDKVLWFQHENGLWRDSYKFVSMLKELNVPKIVTLHTLHFQSSETPSGLRRQEYEFLRSMLPHVDAVTVFTNGCHGAVVKAFPEHREKVHVLKHGIHLHPEINRLSRREAKAKLNDYLLYESDLDDGMKKIIRQEHVLSSPDLFIIGETGFLCPMKQSVLMFVTRDMLQEIVPKQKIVALRIGSSRNHGQAEYASIIRSKTDGNSKLLLDVCVPEDMLRVAQRAFDVNFYWPDECSQSGILAHAIGVGARIAGRRLEGSGEMLENIGAIINKNHEILVTGIRDLIFNPELGRLMEERSLTCAKTYSWKKQLQRHYELAEYISKTMRPKLPLNIRSETETRKAAVAKLV